MQLRFQHFGNSLHLIIPNFKTLQRAIELPETLWIATACPLTGLNCDPKFLAFLDEDHNQRIRAAELIVAVRWLAPLLIDDAGVNQGASSLQLAALSGEAAALKNAAMVVLDSLGASDKTVLSLEQLRQSGQALQEDCINGDGVVAPIGSLEQPIKQILSCFPGKKNRSNKLGVDQELLRVFEEARQEALGVLAQKNPGWLEKEKAEAVVEHNARIQEYFLLCRLKAVRPALFDRLKVPDSTLETVLGNMEELKRLLATIPIAPPDPSGILSWAALNNTPEKPMIEQLGLLFGNQPIQEEDWRHQVQEAQTVLSWYAKTAAPIYQITDLGSFPLSAIQAACERDLTYKAAVETMESLEKLLLYQQNLLRFANNFISMPDLYHPAQAALFERGKLILAGRELRFSVFVPDRAVHVKLAQAANMCLVYAQISRKKVDGSLMQEDIVAPVTAGSSQGMVVGKRGIFKDIAGIEYDAQLTKVILQPVTLGEAMLQPFIRLKDQLSERLQGFSSNSSKLLDEGLSSAAKQATENKNSTTSTGLLAAGGVAVAALGSSLAFIITSLQDISLMEWIRGSLLVILAILIPTVIVGWLKLRSRNLAIVLEGAGWALNDDLLLDAEVGSLFTRRPLLPAGAKIEKSRVAEGLKLRRQLEGAEQGEDPGTRRALLVLLGLILLLGAVSYWEPLVKSLQVYELKILQASGDTAEPPR